MFSFQRAPSNPIQNPIYPSIHKAPPLFQNSGKHWTVDTNDVMRQVEALPDVVMGDVITPTDRAGNTQTTYGHRSYYGPKIEVFRPPPITRDDLLPANRIPVSFFRLGHVNPSPHGQFTTANAKPSNNIIVKSLTDRLKNVDAFIPVTSPIQSANIVNDANKSRVVYRQPTTSYDRPSGRENQLTMRPLFSEQAEGATISNPQYTKADATSDVFQGTSGITVPGEVVTMFPFNDVQSGSFLGFEAAMGNRSTTSQFQNAYAVRDQELKHLKAFSTEHSRGEVRSMGLALDPNAAIRETPIQPAFFAAVPQSNFATQNTRVASSSLANIQPLQNTRTADVRPSTNQTNVSIPQRQISIPQTTMRPSKK